MVGSPITASSAASRGLILSARASSFIAAACVSRSDLPRTRSSSASATASACNIASISAISASSISILSRRSTISSCTGIGCGGVGLGSSLMPSRCGTRSAPSDSS